MSTPKPATGLAATLGDLAAAYQAATVIPHCTSCSRPCCRLDVLVLEMEWPQIRALWQLTETRAAFDARLAAGKGPVEIRPWNGLYYVHSKPCPAYDTSSGRCRVYGQPAKPEGCSDFPVYEDGGVLMVDLRCEAVNVAELASQLDAALGPAYRVRQTADKDFPFLVTLSASRPPRRKPSLGSGKG